MSDLPKKGRDTTPYYSDYPPPDIEAHTVLCLDTNVFVQYRFSIKLLHSIETLGALFRCFCMVLPEVVLKECERQYGEKTVELKGSRPPELESRLREVETQLTELKEEHLNNWRTELRRISQTVDTTDPILRVAYDRLMSKKPPCHDRDETRDAIIWETILAETCPHHLDTVKVFVTNNTQDFPFEKNSSLRDEARESNVLWFKSFADLLSWVAPLQPRPWDEGTEFQKWYVEQDFSWQTTGRIQDELPDHMFGLCEDFDADAEVLDLERTDWDMISDPSTEGETTTVVVSENWDVGVSYAVSADVRIGGHDGVDFPVSAWRRASGRVSLDRSLTFDRHRQLIGNDVEIQEISLRDEDEEWDPREAWLDSLAKDRAKS